MLFKEHAGYILKTLESLPPRAKAQKVVCGYHLAGTHCGAGSNSYIPL